MADLCRHHLSKSMALTLMQKQAKGASPPKPPHPSQQPTSLDSAESHSHPLAATRRGRGSQGECQPRGRHITTQALHPFALQAQIPDDTSALNGGTATTAHTVGADACQHTTLAPTLLAAAWRGKQSCGEAQPAGGCHPLELPWSQIWRFGDELTRSCHLLLTPWADIPTFSSSPSCPISSIGSARLH